MSSTDEFGEGLPRQSGSKGWQNICHMRVDVQTQPKIMSLIASLMPGCGIGIFCSAEPPGV
jgi:hypothetical protein